MRNIAELNLLLRVRVELPEGLRLTTEEFREGWNFARSLDAPRLEKKILKRGWNFIKIADGPLRSGVGETSQEAIASALKLTLRHVSEQFNAVEVEHIELTQYPWFFLARVRVCPFRIQQSTVLPEADERESVPIASRQRRLPLQTAALCPQFASAMPMLKEALTSFESSPAGGQ
jgi:hypothetical protein